MTSDCEATVHEPGCFALTTTYYADPTEAGIGELRRLGFADDQIRRATAFTTHGDAQGFTIDVTYADADLDTDHADGWVVTGAVRVVSYERPILPDVVRSRVIR